MNRPVWTGGGGGSLGIVGTALRDVAGPIRFGKFTDFQRHLGELEAAPADGFRAGHAACHALMNGVSRVVFCGVEDDSRPRLLAEALTRLLQYDPVDIVVVPGMVDATAARTVVMAFGEAVRLGGLDTGRPPPVLWLDAPDRATVDDVLAHRRSLGGDPLAVRVALPHVPTITPGRRRWERLPPTCLLTPLHLGVARSLRGVHEADDFWDEDGARRLRRAGCGLLVPVGVRRLVCLAFPPPLPAWGGPEILEPDGEQPRDPLVARIESELSEVLAPMLDGAPSGPPLWKSLERSATAVLAPYRQRDEIKGFVVRCDADTNEGSPDNPVVEVVLLRHRRVSDVVFRLTLGP